MGAPKTDEIAIRQTLRALREAGYSFDSVDYGDEQVEVSTGDEALDAIMAVDDAYLWVSHPDRRSSHIRFVMGNDPEEVICDHGVSLSHVLDPLTERWG